MTSHYLHLLFFLITASARVHHNRKIFICSYFNLSSTNDSISKHDYSLPHIYVPLISGIYPFKVSTTQNLWTYKHSATLQYYKNVTADDYVVFKNGPFGGIEHVNESHEYKNMEKNPIRQKMNLPTIKREDQRTNTHHSTRSSESTTSSTSSTVISTSSESTTSSTSSTVISTSSESTTSSTSSSQPISDSTTSSQSTTSSTSSSKPTGNPTTSSESTTSATSSSQTTIVGTFTSDITKSSTSSHQTTTPSSTTSTTSKSKYSVLIPKISGYVCFMASYSEESTMFTTKKRVPDSTTAETAVDVIPVPENQRNKGVPRNINQFCIDLKVNNNSQLNCASTQYTHGTTCTVKCLDGYVYPDEEEQKITCSKKTEVLRWSHQSISNPYAKLDTCFKVKDRKIYKTNLELYFDKTYCKGSHDEFQVLNSVYTALENLKASCLHLKDHIKDGINTRCYLARAKCSNRTVRLYLQQIVHKTDQLEEFINMAKTAIDSKSLSVSINESQVPIVSYKAFDIEAKCYLGMYDKKTSQCLACPAGYRIINQSCVKCKMGTYSEKANTSCTSCPTGTSTTQEGSTSPKDCVPRCKVPKINNGYTSYPEGSKVNNGTNITVICRQGYVAAQYSFICSRNSMRVPECGKELRHGRNTNTSKPKSGSLTMTAAISTIVFILVILVTICVAVIVYQKKKSANSVKPIMVR